MLAVEIILPSTDAIDRLRKLQLYARYAVPYYWIVDPPARTIEAYQLTEGQYREAGTLSGTATVSLPPFSDLILDPREIWPEEPPGASVTTDVRDGTPAPARTAATDQARKHAQPEAVLGHEERVRLARYGLDRRASRGTHRSSP